MLLSTRSLLVLVSISALFFTYRGFDLVEFCARGCENRNVETYFEIEMKLRLIFANLDHRTDFVARTFEIIKKNTDKKTSRNLWELADQFSTFVRRRSYPLKAEVEKLYSVNRYKQQKLKKLSESIDAKISRLQNQRCQIDNLVVCSLVQENCGYGCQFHTLEMALFIAYYWEKTLISTPTIINGLRHMSEIFLPVNDKCKYQNMSQKQVFESTINPYLVSSQIDFDDNLFRNFHKDVRKLAKYHSDPAAFINGHFVSYVMRYKTDSDFYKRLQAAKQRMNVPHPYVGVHIRRSDKYSEADFYEVEDYMKRVEEFWEIYFLKHPDRVNTTQRAVYLASDESSIFRDIRTRYPGYTFYYNNTLAGLNSHVALRSTKTGFESFLYDVDLLSEADHLVCTFSSNVCRVAYELLSKKAPDTYLTARSLDSPFLIYGVENRQMAVLDHEGPDFRLRKGDLLANELDLKSRYAGYNHDGTFTGTLGNRLVRVPSYKTKSFD